MPEQLPYTDLLFMYNSLKEDMEMLKKAVTTLNWAYDNARQHRYSESSVSKLNKAKAQVKELLKKPVTVKQQNIF